MIREWDETEEDAIAAKYEKIGAYIRAAGFRFVGVAPERAARLLMQDSTRGRWIQDRARRGRGKPRTISAVRDSAGDLEGVIVAWHNERVYIRDLEIEERRLRWMTGSAD